MAAYQLTAGTSVIREADGATIPADPGNKDWQVYQQWLALGNQPDPYVAPPVTLAMQLAPTDILMGRIAEDLCALIWNTPALKAYIVAQIPAGQLQAIAAKINPRRVLRGQAPLT